MDDESIGRRLRQAREQTRLTQTEAARSVGVTPSALNQYEAGKRRVDVMTLDRLSRLYGFPIRYFFGDDVTIPDWEGALRVRAEGLPHESKAGIARVIEKVHDLEDLIERVAAPTPMRPYPAFAPLPEDTPDSSAAYWAEKARRHFDLGIAPLADMRHLLEAIGYKIFTIPFGHGEDQVSGLFFLHPVVGPIIAMNEDQAFNRRPISLAHEFAHGLFHYDRPAIICRTSTSSPVEVFADTFARHFLVPTEALVERVSALGVQTVTIPEQAVHLARFFSVSYRAILHRLEEEHCLVRKRDDFSVQPVSLAQSLGYAVSPYELGDRRLPIEERLPRIFLELAYRAVREERLSLRRVAELLGISYVELEDRLIPAAVDEPIETYA